MASTSKPSSGSKVEESAPSASTSGVSYDIFINHRGADVKDTLAKRLYKFLTADMGLNIFLDSESLELGDDIPAELRAAINSASLHIAIFSENYAVSHWCLNELLAMCHTGKRIVPIFYHVRPDDVRYAKGVYAAAFERHKKKGRYSLETLRKWKEALHNVSNKIGYIVDEEKDEGMLLKNIAKCVSKEVQKSPVLVAEHPVGLDEIVRDFKSTALQSTGNYHSVQTVGIWGMGGSGKTTLAKKLYNNMYPQMDKASFIYDIRDAANRNLLVMKQKKLLTDLGFKGASADNIEEGKTILISTLQSIRAVIVLDDVDRVDQLYALLPARDSAGSESLIGSGSLIIITTRELDVLRTWGISSIYIMKPLSEIYARKLFCWHAFSQESPTNGFEELVELCLKACSGSPLSLKVLGGQLCGKISKDYWKSQLQKISRIVPDNIKKILKISYDALDDEEKEAFLDTACFFIGEKSNLAIEVWNGSGWDGLYILEKLIDKCLLEINGNNLIRMHDHLRDLGREIANKQSPYRIWFSKQNIQVYNTENGIGIRGIKMMSAEEFEDCSSHAKLMVNTSSGILSLKPSRLGLKFIVAHGSNLNRAISKASKNLVWLRWFNIGQRDLHSLIPLKILRVLELHEDQRTTNNYLRELWLADCDAPLQLRELVISHCQQFQRFPKSIGRLKELKKVVLNSTKELLSLPEEFCHLKSLEHLELCHCRELSSLPNSMGNLTNLRHLDLCGCENMGSLPDSCKELMLLEHLSLWLCYNVTFKSDIMENMSKLEYLCFSSCLQLEELPCHITNQESLKELDLRDMERLREVPMQIGQLSKLTKLCVGGASLTSLPPSLGDLSTLTTFQITFSPRLECLPDSLGRLNLLKRLEIQDSGIKFLPESISQLINLESLSIYSCQISELNLGAGSSSSSLCNLKSIHLLFNDRLSKISISNHSCTCLETLKVEKNSNLKEIEGLPSSIRKLVISGCPLLCTLPCLAELTFLREFELRDCYQVKEIQGLPHCGEMEVFSIQRLNCVESLTVHLTAMRKSVVAGCIQSMQKWPDEIIVCTRAVQNAASLVKCSAFLSVVDCCTNVETAWDQGPKLVVKRPTNGNTIIVCFIMLIPYMAQLSIRGVNLITQICGAKVEEGKWVWIGVFTQHSKWHSSNRYEAYLAGESGMVEKGFVAMVAEDRVMDAFRGSLNLMEI